MSTKLPLGSPENRILACKEYARLWEQYFQYFSDDLSERVFTEADEAHFEQLITVLATRHYRFSQLAGKNLKNAGDVLKVLNETASLQFLKSMPEAALAKLQVDWHAAFLSMHKAIGKWKAELSPQRLQKFLELEGQINQAAAAAANAARQAAAPPVPPQSGLPPMAYQQQPQQYQYPPQGPGGPPPMPPQR